MLFGGNFYKMKLLSLKIYPTKALLQIIFLCPLFEIKNQNKLITIKIYTHKILLMHLNLLSAKNAGKMGWKSNNKHFSKQMLLFHLILPFILRDVKNCAQFLECYCCFIRYMFSIFIKIIFECYNLLI